TEAEIERTVDSRAAGLGPSITPSPSSGVALPIRPLACLRRTTLEIRTGRYFKLIHCRAWFNPTIWAWSSELSM
ncbi:MAG: hypothetical protein ACREUU_21680, partial [Gammaproteobacteria bacterium]